MTMDERLESLAETVGHLAEEGHAMRAEAAERDRQWNERFETMRAEADERGRALDKRLDRLEERVEALTHHGEVLTHMQQHTEKSIRLLGRYIRAITADHEFRLQDLEGEEGDLQHGTT